MTSCPTIWSLEDGELPHLGRSSAVTVTLTDYKRADDVDLDWVGVLSERYSDLRIVGMGPGDRAYAESLGLLRAHSWAGTGTQALVESLRDSDFVGTRLHAGVRALQLGRPALILAVDNRAAEIGKDTGLPVRARDDIEGVRATLVGSATFKLSLPRDAISRWHSEVDRAMVAT